MDAKLRAHRLRQTVRVAEKSPPELAGLLDYAIETNGPWAHTLWEDIRWFNQYIEYRGEVEKANSIDEWIKACRKQPQRLRQWIKQAAHRSTWHDTQTAQEAKWSK